MPIASRMICPATTATTRMIVAYTVARSAVRRRSARVRDAVNPAKIARLPIGSIVVQIVAKSLLILMSKGDIGERGSAYTRGRARARQSYDVAEADGIADPLRQPEKFRGLTGDCVGIGAKIKVASG